MATSWAVGMAVRVERGEGKKKRGRGVSGGLVRGGGRARARERVCVRPRACARPPHPPPLRHQPTTHSSVRRPPRHTRPTQNWFWRPGRAVGREREKKKTEGVRGGGRGREGERGPRPPPPPLSLSVHTLTLLMAARSKARAAATSVSWSPREVVLPPAEIWGERGGAREGKREEREGEVFGLRGGAFPPP